MRASAVQSAMAVVCTLLAFSKWSSGGTCADADLVLRNGNIITMDKSRQLVSSMAVRDGRIQAVGTDGEIANCISPRTRMIDLKQQTVLPGLIDVHTHALQWAQGMIRKEIDASYPQVRSVEHIVRLVRERAAAAPAGEWVIGSGWDNAKLAENRYLTRRDLDSVSPNNPVYLMHVTGHLAAVNSAALALGGITKATADPPGGVIERDPAGEPTGILKDNAMMLVQAKLPPNSPDVSVRAVKLAAQKALETGLTTIHVILGPGSSAAEMRAYQEAYQGGQVKLRVQMMPRVRNLKEVEELVRLGLHTGFGNDYLKLGAVKMFADGGMGARTIAIYPPPVEGEPGNLGLLIWTPEDMQKAHLMLASAGWQLATHAIGDRAIDEVLDSYAAAMKVLNLRDPRFRIIHAGISTPAVQKRMQDLHVLVDGNPPFVYWIGSYFQKYGPDRVRWSYPGKSYFEKGIITAGASDVSVTPISPWWGIWAAVARRELLSGQVLAPEERLTAAEALQLYTFNGAYAGFEENDKGSLELGKLADFIVVDRDVLRIPIDQLKDVQVLKTFVGGELVYDKQAATH